ncbi:MAG: hypothetical protein NT144_06430 [Bacteroidia bacterium]|nr:hypothetical protein [Bacteroidia bacterium]
MKTKRSGEGRRKSAVFLRSSDFQPNDFNNEGIKELIIMSIGNQ